MEKVPRSVYWNVPKVVLYREHVAELIDIFERIGTEVEITIGGYKLQNSGELVSVPVVMTS